MTMQSGNRLYIGHRKLNYPGTAICNVLESNHAIVVIVNKYVIKASFSGKTSHIFMNSTIWKAKVKRTCITDAFLPLCASQICYMHCAQQISHL